MNLSTNNLRGICVDGAANTSGSSHQNNRSSHQNNRIICDVPVVVKDVSTFMLESAKRKTTHSNVVLNPFNENSESTTSGTKCILPLCTTRWTVRGKSIMRFIDKCSRVVATTRSILQDRSAAREDKSIIMNGYLEKKKKKKKKLEKFETLLASEISSLVFGPCEQLAKAIQSPDYTAVEAKHASHLLKTTFLNLRNDDTFDNFFCSVQEIVGALRDLSHQGRIIFDQVERLVCLLLCVPASAATGERYFSASGRVKKYLRAEMSQ
ncbi:hypothetical protein PR048_028941 [Dryococelus australis]|uniref:HAT C-terminal dimerisation domain-containing protein n=1 Tax=Dryococelus australis TaxID=614101 RepID=A0ABQ9GBZ4_9NEOP|nr:hypothetical protein PR048_028941 [Dryococelus australis]